MKITIYLTVALLVASVFSSCKKGGDEVSAEDKARAEAFKTAIAGKQFRLMSYTADKPIDYDEEDTEVKEETDLWPYVSLWIKDDMNNFDLNSGKVTITQNEHKFASIADETFTKDFSIGADSKGVYLNFLNYQYNPLQYRIVDFNATEFTVYVDWHSGAKVISKFEIVE